MKTILLVEDEDQVRIIFRIMLEREGYRLFDASDEPKAREIIEAYPAQIDLLITDVSLPGGSGLSLAELACRLDPNCQVLLMSGYGHHLEDDHEYPMMAKPFSPTELIGVVKEMMQN